MTSLLAQSKHPTSLDRRQAMLRVQVRTFFAPTPPGLAVRKNPDKETLPTILQSEARVGQLERYTKGKGGSRKTRGGRGSHDRLRKREPPCPLNVRLR